jgi:hypothetical protein
MTYIDDANNEKKYVPSIYAKEELPTWNEIYNEFYKEKAWFYDPDNESQQANDLYWKVPHRKILLGWICNQFNKMLFEDSMKSAILNWFNINFKDRFVSQVDDIRFFLIEDEESLNVSQSDTEKVDSTLVESKVFDTIYSSYNDISLPPVIYTCEIPSTGERSIFASSHPSVNIKDFTSILKLKSIIKSGNVFYMISGGNDDNIFWDLVSEMIKDIIAYFEGDFVGWKDENGNPINGDAIEIKPGCGYQSGSDASI